MGVKKSPRMPDGPHEFDKSNLRQVIYDSPRQFKTGFDLAREIRLDGHFERVIFYGEGGSAFPFALVDTIARDIAEKEGKAPPLISQNYTYTLRPEALAGSLNVFCSYSGGTEEVLSTLGSAIEHCLPVVGLASGGKLEEVCTNAGVPFIKLPMPTADFQPRMGTGYQVASGLQILSNHGIVADVEGEICGQADGFEGRMKGFEKKGIELAGRLQGKIPVIWASQKFKELGRVWSIKFNEHSKNPAFWNFFPELNHNSMVGYTNLADQFFAIMLCDRDDDQANLRRYEVTADTLKSRGMDSEIIDLEGESTFAKIFNSVYLGDFAAYYLAELNGVDPTPVDMVEEFKRKLKA